MTWFGLRRAAIQDGVHYFESLEELSCSTKASLLEDARPTKEGQRIYIPLRFHIHIPKRFSKEVFHHTIWKLDWGATSFNLLGIHFTTDLENIVDINYSLQLPKMKALIKQWKRIILTPIGRITVVKTFIIPKLNHLFIFLPTPTKHAYLH